MFVVVSTVIVYTVGGRAVIRGEMTLGALVAMGLYVGMIYAPLLALVDFYRQLVQARVSLDRVREIRARTPEVVEDPAPKPEPEPEQTADVTPESAAEPAPAPEETTDTSEDEAADPDTPKPPLRAAE